MQLFILHLLGRAFQLSVVAVQLAIGGFLTLVGAVQGAAERRLRVSAS